MTTAVLAALLFSSLPLAAQEPAPAPSKPPIHKVTISQGGVTMVRYSTTVDSPRVRALCRVLQWAENEVGLVEQVQALKMEYVGYERQLAALRAAQQLNPLASPYSRVGYGSYYGGESVLSYSLASVIASEATPEAALQLIRMLELAEVDLAEELKKLAPKERQELETTCNSLPKALALLRAKCTATPARQMAGPAVPAAPAPLSPPVGISPANRPPSVRPIPTQPLDAERQTLERERDLMNRERLAYEQEQDACSRLLQQGDASERLAAEQRLGVARTRWANALQRWTDACNHWSDVSARRGGEQREQIAVPPSSVDDPRPAVPALPQEVPGPR
jgi:hypothetical protein